MNNSKVEGAGGYLGFKSWKMSLRVLLIQRDAGHFAEKFVKKDCSF